MKGDDSSYVNSPWIVFLDELPIHLPYPSTDLEMSLVMQNFSQASTELVSNLHKIESELNLDKRTSAEDQLKVPIHNFLTEGPDPRKVDTSGASYAAVVSIAEVSVSKTSGATRLHQECRRRVL